MNWTLSISKGNGEDPDPVKFSMTNFVTNWKYLFCRYQGKGPTHIGRNYSFQKSLDLWEVRPKFNFNGPLGSTSKLHIHRTPGKHVQNSNPWTSGKHVQNSISMDLQEARPNFKSLEFQEACPKLKSLDQWEVCPKFNFNGPLRSTSKFQIHRNSRKYVQIQIHRTFGKHVQTSNHQTFGKQVQISNPWTSGKHVQNSISMDLWKARLKFNFNEPLGSTSKFQIHRTFGKHV